MDSDLNSDETFIRSQPFIITLFKAILHFKRMAKKIRRWAALKTKVKKTHLHGKIGEQYAFTTILNQSQQSVDFSKAGARVINLKVDKLEKYISESKAKKLELKNEKLIAIKKIKNRRRFDKTRFQDNQFDKKVLSSKAGATSYVKSTHNIARSLAIKLDKMHGTTTQVIKEAENIQSEALRYIKGTNIYFGSTIAIQARHGGYLSYLHKDIIRASAPMIFPTSKFSITNADDPSDKGIFCYGKAVLLHTTDMEVLGANFGSGHMVNSKTRKIIPTLIQMHENDSKSILKAHQYGRWIVLNRDDPLGTLGVPVKIYLSHYTLYFK